MKVLITGICGFAGSELARNWLEAEPGIAICGLDNLSRPGSETNRTALQKLGIKVMHCDIRLASDIETLPPVDWVIDATANPSVLAGVAAAGTSRQLIEHNLAGTVNLLEYCKKHSAGFVLVSTSRVYSISRLAEIAVEPVGRAFQLSSRQPLPSGVSTAGIREDFSTRPPVSLYGSTKLASELIALEYGAAFGFSVWINRCGVLAGGGQFGRIDQGIYSYWIHSWFHRRPLAFIGYGGTGHQVRDCLHPRDLVPLLRKQVQRGDRVAERTFNIGGGPDRALSLAQLSDWCADRLGHHVVSTNNETRPFDVPWIVMDSTLARTVWDWRPETTLNALLEEIAAHAERNPDWLEISGAL